jgi:hypothetical protein
VDLVINRNRSAFDSYNIMHPFVAEVANYRGRCMRLDFR